MMTGDIVLVEPGVNLIFGHYREKLLLWVEELQQAGWRVSVACLVAPEPEFLPGVTFNAVLRKTKYRGSRLSILWLVFRTYLLALRLANKGNAAVLGLTTSTLLPVGAAYFLGKGARAFFGQIVMNGNTFEESNNPLRRYLEATILNFLLRSGVFLFPNMEQTRQSLLAEIKDRSMHRQVITLHDPIRLPPERTSKKRADDILLVPGPDDYRRTSLYHLLQAELASPPRSIWIHAPGGVSADIAGRISKNFNLRVLDQYETPQSFVNLFASASWCLLAYRPTFLHGSGLLAQAVVGDTPVLSSRFPYAEELFQKYGRLGELFEFGDMPDLARAWDRLRHWTLQQWKEFHEASARVRADVSADRVVQTVANLFAASNARR
jgi:hypothetical protein